MCIGNRGTRNRDEHVLSGTYGIGMTPDYISR
jgi:hypothetical protein